MIKINPFFRIIVALPGWIRCLILYTYTQGTKVLKPVYGKLFWGEITNGVSIVSKGYKKTLKFCKNLNFHFSTNFRKKGVLRDFSNSARWTIRPNYTIFEKVAIRKQNFHLYSFHLYFHQIWLLKKLKKKKSD